MAQDQRKLDIRTTGRAGPLLLPSQHHHPPCCVPVRVFQGGFRVVSLLRIDKKAVSVTASQNKVGWRVDLMGPVGDTQPHTLLLFYCSFKLSDPGERLQLAKFSLWALFPLPVYRKASIRLF